MDEHIPRAITAGLRLKNIDVLTVQEDNYAGKSDTEILDRASFLKRSLFTHDDDLLVIYAHQLKVSIGECIKNLNLIANAGETEDMISQVIFLPLKNH